MPERVRQGTWVEIGRVVLPAGEEEAVHAVDLREVGRRRRLAPLERADALGRR